MTKEKQILKPIQRLYKCNAIDLMMFGWVCGVRRFIPSANIIDLIDEFMTFNDFTEDEYNSESAQTSFQRMWNYYKNELK